MPQDWTKFDQDGNNPLVGWAVRDTVVNFGGNTRPRAIGSKSLEIPWYAGNGGNLINDDWVWSNLWTAQVGDSVIWSMLIGNDTTFQFYRDSMQVWVCLAQDPGAVLQKLATIRSADTGANDWMQHKFNLNAFSGQEICIGFRYYMDVSVDGLWCNIDNVFIGNRSAIGITPISNEVPKRFELKQNYPNPFNPVTNIEFAIAKTSDVRLIVFNSLGQQVGDLVNQQLQPGTYKYDFNAGNLPSGAYYYRLSAGDFVKTNKMILVK